MFTPLPNPRQASFFLQRRVKHQLIPCPFELNSLQRLLTVTLVIQKLFLDFLAEALGWGLVYNVSVDARRRQRSVFCAPH